MQRLSIKVGCWLGSRNDKALAAKVLESCTDILRCLHQADFSVSEIHWIRHFIT